MKETITFRPSKANKDLLEKLSKLAKKENRNLNNFIETILLNYISIKENKSKK